MNHDRLKTQRQQKILLLTALQDDITTEELSQKLQQPRALIEEDIKALDKAGLLQAKQKTNT